jgi:hypothetical protein
MNSMTTAQPCEHRLLPLGQLISSADGTGVAA